MYDIKNFTKTPIYKLSKLKVGDKLEILTYKKDRKIIIIKKDLNLYTVIEQGFSYREFKNIKIEQLKKLLKKLQNWEFPRSNKYFLKVVPSVECEQLTLLNNSNKYNITIDNNKYIKKFFNKFKIFENDIKNNIYNILPEIIDFKPHKIKPAYHLKRRGLTIFEYKIIVDGNNFRAGYTINNKNVELFYITTTTIKKDFVKELENSNLTD